MVMIVSLIAVLMLSLTVTPVLAAAPPKATPKTEKLDYSISGNIYGNTNYGIITLTLSGNMQLKLTPDYQYGGRGGQREWTLQWERISEEEYSDEGESWKIVTTVERETAIEINGDYYVQGWYSPQVKLNGKIDATWQDGSTTTFIFQLEPYAIQKQTMVGIKTVEVTETTVNEYYKLVQYEWDGGVFSWWEFQYAERGEPVSSGIAPYDVAQTTLFFDCSGKIQVKGRSALQGTFMLADTFSALNGGSREHSVSGWGQFGPYYLSAQ